MKYAAAYIRVSDERQDEYSPDSQLKMIKEYASRNDYDIPEEYVFYDDGISGRSTKNRKAFNDMISFATSKEHPVDAIIVWKFSRFARNRKDSVLYKDILARKNVIVKSVSEDIGDSPFSALVEGNIEFFDEYYSIRLSGEVKRGMKEKVNRGEPTTSPPFGYKMINKAYYPDENAEYVKQIYQLFLAGDGCRKIARYLQSQGILTKRGNPPDNRFVEYILTNPVYNGKIRYCTNGKASSSRYNKPDLDIMIVDGKHEAIIDDETWQKVQEKLEIQKQRYGKSQRKEQPVNFMLKGLLRCDCCGATLVRQCIKEPSVQCHNYARGQCKVSHHLSIKKANTAVINGLEKSLRNYDFNIIPKFTDKIEIINYDELIKKEKEKIQRASAAYDAGFDTLEEYGRKKRAYQNRIDELIKEKESNIKQQQNTIPKEFVNTVASVIEIIKNPDATEQEKNEALRTIIHHIDFEKSANNLRLYFYA